MGLFIRRPRIIPGPIGYRSSGRHRGRKSYAGRFIIGVILTGATFGVNPVLGALLVTAEIVTVVLLLVRYLRPARPAKVKPARPGNGGMSGPAWKAEHVPASAEYRAAHPEGPRDWEPTA